MAKCNETPTQRRSRLADTASRRFRVFMLKALKLCDECNVDPRKVLEIFASHGIPAANHIDWTEWEGDEAAAEAGIPDVDWDKLIEKLGPMIEKLLNESAKAK